MPKYLMIAHGQGGFGAGVMARAEGLLIAKAFGRELISYNALGVYDEPYVFKYSTQDSGPPYDFLRNTNSPARCILFDYRYYMNFILPKRGAIPLGHVSASLAAMPLAPAYQDVVDAHLRAFPRIESSVALHIRRGDKIVSAPYVPMDQLIDATLEMCQRQETQSVYINSDSQEAAAEAVSRLQAAGVDGFFDEREKRYNNANWEMATQKPDLRRQETETGVKIIYSMGRARALVGASNVHFVRAASALGGGRAPERFAHTLIDPPGGLPPKTFDRRFLNWMKEFRGATRRTAKFRQEILKSRTQALT